MSNDQQEATMRVVSDLQEKLGPKATATLEDWREKHWAQHGTMQQGPLPPGAEEAWRKVNLQRYQETKKQMEQKNREQQQLQKDKSQKEAQKNQEVQQ